MTTHPFQDLAPPTAAHFSSIEDRVAPLLSTEQAVVIMQGEALAAPGGRHQGDTVTARHTAAAAATRAGALAPGGGLEPYAHEAEDAAPVATNLRAPSGVVASELVASAPAAFRRGPGGRSRISRECAMKLDN